MKEYDATEVAFKNGESKGYSRGFADGMNAAGIAPIQWRDAKKYPFVPEAGTEYFVILNGEDGWCWYQFDEFDQLSPVDTSDVRFWVPMVLPAEITWEGEK